jgi:tetratricopeptide (TPR) repeat protein
MQEQGMAFLRTAPDIVVHESARFVATLTFDFAGARRIAHLLAEPGRSDEARGTYHVLAAFLDLTVGSWSGARRELLAAAPHQPASALEYRGLFALLPFLPVPDSEREALRELLTEWNAPTSSPRTNPFPTLDLHHDAHAVVRLYLLGALSARLGHPTAMAYAAQLDAVVGSPDAEALARDLAHSLRARHAAGRGEYAVALAELERARIEPRQVLAASSPPFYIQTAERWLRAELLQQLGRYGEALRWYRCVCQSSLYDLIYLAPAHLRQAEIHERLGEPDHAAEHYRRFLELWKGCDPELRPMLGQASRRLEQLERTGSPRHAGRGSRIG